MSHGLKLLSQIYFEIYEFLNNVVCKSKWKTYVQIIIITNKIQIYKMIG